MDKHQSIRFFLKLCETLSFKNTALHFGVPASTVSRSIKALEERLGVVLFERTTRQVRLTEAGRIYSSEVAEPMRALEAAEHHVKTQSREPEGVLRLTALPGYGELRLFAALDAFRESFPKVICDVTLTDRYLDLSTGEVDVAIRATATPPDFLVARRLHAHRYVLVAAPSYLDRCGRPQKLAELADHPALGYRSPSGVVPWLARLDSGDVVTVPRRLTYITNQGLQLLQLALRGEGLAFLPLWGVADELAAGRLEEISVEDAGFVKSTGPQMSLFLLYDPLKGRLGKIRAAVDFLVDVLADE